MSPNSYYYGEIAAKISGHLFSNPDHITQLEKIMKDTSNDDESLWSLCADAARVFDTLENLAGDFFLDWPAALEHYAEGLLNLLLIGQKPNMLDMIYMANRSLIKARLKEKSKSALKNKRKTGTIRAR